MKKSIVIVCLIALGALLRFAFLDRLPVSPNWDEVSHGYNAYSILKTGMDEWGKPFPLIFRAFGDYKLPLYIYLSTIPVAIFGLNIFAIRFISALSGTLAILGIFLLSKILFPDKVFRVAKRQIKMEHLAAFLLAISPWHFFVSRPALEANLSLTLIIFGFYYFIRFVKSQSSLIPSVFLLGLSLHSYNTARIFVPLMVVASFIVFRRSIFSKQKFMSLFRNFKSVLAVLLALLFSGLVLYQVYAGEGTARYEKVKILSPATVFQIGEQRAASTLSPLLAKLIHNRPLYLVTTVTKNYLGYFSPQFFFQTWGAQFQFAIPNTNLLTVPVYLLMCLGFILCLPRLKTKENYRFLYLWLLLSPVAASLTIDPPQALRPNPMIPALIIFASLGVARLLKIIPEKIKTLSLILITLWILMSLGQYLIQYQGSYAKKYSSSWQYGYRQVISFIVDHQSEYDRVFITKRYGEPHIFYTFYTRMSPNMLQPGPDNIRFEQSDWFWTDKIDNVYFVNDWQIPSTPISTLTLESGSTISAQRSLLVTSPDHLPVNAHVIETINFLDDTPAFIITSIP
ncbi:MAG TPA: glycosyltransferase family 39 protein [Candidatus Woesebacteria bacterium]|nr:glycosyltransferase family 39 protein [Candidatus Woesebacteria bacterium]